MRPITFNRLIVLPEHIVSIKDVYIEDDIHYSMDKEELKCKGFIKINFKANFELETKEMNERIDVDVTLSLAKIDCAQDLKLQFKDYIVNIDDHLLRFTIRYELLGNGEKVISYKEVGDMKLEDDLMKALVRSDVEVESFKDVSDSIERIIANEGVEVIGEELVPLTENSVSDIEMSELEEVTIDKLNNDKVSSRELSEEAMATSSDLKGSEIKEEKNTLFKEKYDISYFFYKVLDENTSYEDIANKFDIDVTELRKMNKDGDLYKGKLVKIVK